jgi:Activator of Hsp90 ATPase homolog 1-like protein
VFTVSDQPEDDLYELVTVVLNDLGEDGTEMHFQQQGRMSAEEYERAGQGWSTFFERIDARLATRG